MGVVKVSYRRSSNGGTKSSKQATRYAAHRKGEDAKKGGREIYDKEGVISKEQAYRNIEKADQQSKDAYHYRLTLSHANTGEGVDHNATTRETMQRLEERHANQGGAVTWHAVNHTDHSNHEHTHVIAVTEKRISASDLAEMRAELDRSYERHTHRDQVQDQAQTQERAEVRQEVQQQADPPRREAEPAQEKSQQEGVGQGGQERPASEPAKQKKPRQQIELDWQFTAAEREEQRRDERYLEGKPSLITSGEASRDFVQYKQIEAALDPQESRELFLREMEWRNEQKAAREPQKLTESYFEDHNAFLQDLRDSKHMNIKDRQQYLDSKADERWMHRQVNERDMRGDEVRQAFLERGKARREERFAQVPEERRLKWGAARLEANLSKHEQAERQARPDREHPTRSTRNQNENQQGRRGGHER